MKVSARVVRLHDVADQICSGDLLLFRRTSPWWRPFASDSLISIGGLGVYSHAASVDLWHGDLFCVEVREWHGGRAVTLESQVLKYPGRIDVYEANAQGLPEYANPQLLPPGIRPRVVYNRTAAMRYMRRLAGCDYGWHNVFAASLSRLFGVRLFVPPNLDDLDVSKYPPFCSQARVMADRIGGGVDPVTNLADAETDPSMLARSPFYRYRFTLGAI